MTGLILTTLAVALNVSAPWHKQLQARPAPKERLKVTGAGAPRGLMLYAGGTQISLKVPGPGKLKVRAHALTLKHSNVAGGAISIQVVGGRKTSLRLAAKGNRAWKLPTHAMFALTGKRSTTVNIPEGTAKVVLNIGKRLALGAALSVEFVPATSGAVAASNETQTPAATGDKSGATAAQDEVTNASDVPISTADTKTPAPKDPDASSPSEGTAANHADKDGTATEAPGEPEADLSGTTTDTQTSVDGTTAISLDDSSEDSAEPGIEVSIPEGSVTLNAAAGLVIRSGNSKSSMVSGAGQREKFWLINQREGLTVDLVGPGNAVLELHALRDDGNPDTLTPVILAVMLDDVLLKTVSLGQPASSNYEATDIAGDPSSRIQVRVGVSAGAHTMKLGLSDNAAIGMLVRPWFDGAAAPAHSVSVSAEHPQVGTDGSGLAINFGKGLKSAALAGVWTPFQLQATGLSVWLDASLDIAAISDRASVGLGAGWLSAARTQSFKDPRTAKGTNEVITKISSVPVLFDARWMLLAGPGMQLGLGAGGGVMLTWANAETFNLAPSGAMQASPAGYAHVTATWALGPGSLMGRLSLIASNPVDTTSVQSISPTGLVLNIGYQLGAEG